MKKIIIGLLVLGSFSVFAQNDYHVASLKSESSVAKFQDMLAVSISGEAAEMMYKKGLEVNGVLFEKEIYGVKTIATKYADFSCVKSEIASPKHIRYQCGVEILDTNI
jgi:hypothetical protein